MGLGFQLCISFGSRSWSGIWHGFLFGVWVRVPDGRISMYLFVFGESVMTLFLTICSTLCSKSYCMFVLVDN